MILFFIGIVKGGISFLKFITGYFLAIFPVEMGL